MKTKKNFMLLAAVLLSVSAFAQSGNNEPLKGDVNGDGVVDYADIDAVIEIMKNAGGYVDSNYYWYIGHTDPSTMNEISSSSMAEGNGPGWRKIGTTLPEYNINNKLWSNGINGDIDISETTWSNIYIAVPNTTIIPRDGLNTSGIANGSYTKLPNTKTINGVTYTIYKSTSQYLMLYSGEIW